MTSAKLPTLTIAEAARRLDLLPSVKRDRIVAIGHMARAADRSGQSTMRISVDDFILIAETYDESDMFMSQP